MKYIEGSPLFPLFREKSIQLRSGKSGGDLKLSKFIPHETKNRYIPY
jgi:hypothetical protein